MFEHSVYIEHTSIMPVRVSDHYVSQRRHFKLQRISGIHGDPHAAKIPQNRLECKPCVAKAVIGKQRLLVTCGTFLLENIIAKAFRKQESSLAAFYLVVFAVSANHGKHELAERESH